MNKSQRIHIIPSLHPPIIYSLAKQPAEQHSYLSGLVTQAQQGDANAIDYLTRRASSLASWFVKIYAHDLQSADKEDLLQDLLLAFIKETMQTYSVHLGKVTFDSWTFRCMRSRTKNYLYKYNKRKNNCSLDVLLPNHPDLASDSATSDLERALAYDDAHLYLSVLHLSQRELVCRHLGIGCTSETYRELGEAYSRSPSTIKERYAHALNYMRSYAQQT